MELILDSFGEGAVLALAGVLIGAAFGALAQRSSFCLRAATVELAERRFGDRLSVWLLAFAAALAAVQGLIYGGYLDLSEARALAATGSMSGAVVGGLMFGVGMILARGCASRLLVLAATGNLRALVTGLVLTLVAQAAYTGVLSPMRTAIAGLWTVPGGDARHLGVSPVLAVSATLLLIGVAWMRARQVGLPVGHRLAAMGVGLCVAGGWWVTYAISLASFEVIPITSITFTGPAMDTLMVLVDRPQLVLNFGVGLVPGVALGSAAAALLSGQWRIQRFGPDTPMERYLIGAALMGFGAMLAGGCAVGAGLSGGAALSLTAWTAVFCMWLGAMAAHLVVKGGSVQDVRV